MINASKRAHEAAQKAALSALSNLNLESQPSPFNLKNEDASKDNDDQIEFEISEDLIKFYEESIQFRKDKSNELTFLEVPRLIF